MEEPKEVLFGTGELFIVTTDEMDVETETKVGESNGEAALNIATEFVDVRGGVGNDILKSVRTSETITFNAGFVTFDLEVISKFLAGNYSEDTEAGLLTFELGGAYKVPVNHLRFIHTKDDGKKITMDMWKAQNRAGLEWIFNSEEASAFAFEFTLAKDTSKNNIVVITEEI
ncbi:hypothetical protein [Oceanobacillus massiliensis]|uniref:hypothetical protein n=1 Tax=Oceanobacillus massiliensis TaxID=1465765 RepID=UPI00301AF670